MRFQLTVATAAVALMTLASAAPASAFDFPTFYLDASSFHAEGTIVQKTDFDSYGPGVTPLGASESFGQLTLLGDPLAIVGVDAPQNPVRNVVTNTDPTKYTKGLIGQTGYNMLSFKLGNLSGYGDQVFVELFTNVTSSAYGLYPGPAPEVLTFYGFIVPKGEYFLGFQMNNTDYGSNFEPTPIDQSFGLTDIELGATGEICLTRVCTGGGVPEPASWGLMILGFGLAGVTVRGRRRAIAGAFDA